jgi:ketosteroid isomerase-like protein
MWEENVEIVGDFFQAVAREDWVGAEGLFDPECQIDDYDMPDASGYRGHKGFFDWVAQWDEAWEDWEMKDLDIRPLTGERVIALFTMVAKGRSSGVELSRRDAMIYELQGGKIRHLAYYNEQQRDLALEAAGLPERQ